ncbi:hypothetical protein [Streptomyces sp. YIM S03343]
MSDSWVGVDIGALGTMADTYKNAKKKLEEPLRPISTAVETLVSDASWKGESAEKFRAHWSEDALTAGAFAHLVYEAGDILDKLVGALTTCETCLQNAAHIATRKGVLMSDKGVPLELATATPPSADDQKTIKAMGEYEAARNDVLHTAQHARLVAADKLRGLYEQVSKVTPSDKITLADVLRGLYAYDAEDARAGGKKARANLDSAKAEAKAAKQELKQERKTFQQQGRRMADDHPANSAYRDAVAKVDSLEEDIARADYSSKLPYDRVLNFKLSDAADAMRLGKGLEKVPEFLKEIPVLDVAAAGACGLLEASEDHDKGWSWQHSVTVDEGANLGGLAIGAGVVALMPEAAPAAAVAVVGVGAAVISTSLIDHSLHEHWSEDIHDHGVVGGVLTGTGDVLSETKDDGVRLAKDVWHGVTSIF